MPLFSAGLACFVVGLVAALVIVVHAFRSSLSQGFLCLLVPLYIIYYAFARFEHRRRGLVIALLIAGFGLGMVLTEVGAARAIADFVQE